MPRAKSQPIIGIIGGIGSGKSTIARLFATLGCAIIDADQLAKEALDCPASLKQLEAWWGPGVIGPDGKADRKAIAKIVFGQPDELIRLEQLIHPQVNTQRAALRQAYRNDPGIVAIIEDCPLLLEKKLEGDCDAIVFIEASQSCRQQRVQATRGWSPQELAAREKNQMPLDIKARRADYVIENNGSETQSLAHVRQVLSQILERSA